MLNSWLAATTVVIDSNVAVWAVLPKVATLNTTNPLINWHQQGYRLVVPDFWLAEATSVIRQLVYTKTITLAEGQLAIADLFTLGVEIVPLSLELCQSAFAWATRFQQSKVYDSLYVALAEQRHAEFWTGDKRLVNRARQLKLDWVHWVGESDTQKT
jgi:predicted nucleic acid-binding protein